MANTHGRTRFIVWFCDAKTSLSAYLYKYEHLWFVMCGPAASCRGIAAQTRYPAKGRPRVLVSDGDLVWQWRNLPTSSDVQKPSSFSINSVSSSLKRSSFSINPLSSTLLWDTESATLVCGNSVSSTLVCGNSVSSTPARGKFRYRHEGGISLRYSIINWNDIFVISRDMYASIYPRNNHVRACARTQLYVRWSKHAL